MRNHFKWLPVMSLLLVSAMWGGHAVVVKTLEKQLSPLELTVWRYTLGAVLYLPIAPRLVRRMSKMSRSNFWQLALTGLLWAILYPFFFYQSLQFLSPAESLLIINISPIITSLIGWIMLKEHLKLTQGIGILLSFFGVAWTTLGQWELQSSIIGVIFALGGATVFALYTVSSRSLSKKIPLLDMIAGTSIWGAIDAWIIIASSGHVKSIFIHLESLNYEGWIELVYVVLIVSTISYIFYAYALKRTTVAEAATLTFYPQIIFGALIQWVWLSIKPSTNVLISAMLIISGMIVMNLGIYKKSSKKTIQNEVEKKVLDN